VSILLLSENKQAFSVFDSDIFFHNEFIIICLNIKIRSISRIQTF